MSHASLIAAIDAAWEERAALTPAAKGPVREAVETAQTVDPDRPIELRAEHAVVVTGDRDRLRQIVTLAKSLGGGWQDSYPDVPFAK